MQVCVKRRQGRVSVHPSETLDAPADFEEILKIQVDVANLHIL